jgi:DNA mismatch repair ATPase MutS
MQLATLEEISDRITGIVQEIINQGGEITEEQEQALEKWEAAFPEKVGQIIHVIARMQAESNMAKELETKAKAFRQARENAEERLRKYMARNMHRTGQKKLQVGVHSITLSAGRETLKLDPALLPDQYVEEVIEVTRVPLKDLIKANLKSGVEIDGAEIVPGTPYVTIR